MRRKSKRQLGKGKAREKAGKEKQHHGKCRRTIKNNGDGKEYGKRKNMKAERGSIGRETRDIESRSKRWHRRKIRRKAEKLNKKESIASGEMRGEREVTQGY